MESLFRRPNGRKHSAVRNAFSSSPSSTFSLKNPYDDVLLSKRGKKKFATHEYAEIFSGSSSIPVLDLSSLDERVGSAECRSSRLDYSNIFGGLGNDEVALPYEELLNGAAKKTKTQSPADASLSCQEPGSLHPSEKTKRSSGEASDQSIDGVKQHFNISFNKTSQRISNASNGKTHIAQLHAVPGFTYFVDGTPRPQKKGLRPLPSLKREVSHTWSFKEGVEVATVQDRSAWEKLHVPDNSCNVGEVKLKPCSVEVPLPASHLSNPNDNNDPSGPGFPSFDSKEASKGTAGESSLPLSDEELDKNSVVALSAAVLNKAVEQAQESSCNVGEVKLKAHSAEVPLPASHLSNPNDNNDPNCYGFPIFESKDASKRTAGESSPPLSDEELDKNSVAAVSAAALKKAVEQAQESIRIARMIMERKKEGFQGGPKPSSKSHLRVKDKKETGSEHEADGSKDNYARETYEKLNSTFPIFTGINEKFAPSLNHTEKFLNTGKAEVERVRENVEATKEHKDEFAEAGKRFAASWSPSRARHTAENVALENVGEHVEVAEACRAAINFTGLVPNGECRTETLDPGKVHNHDNRACFADKLPSHLQEMETIKRLIIHQLKGEEFIAELSERAPNTSKRVQQLEKSVDDALVQCQAAIDLVKEPESVSKSSEEVLNSSQSMQEQEKIVHEAGEHLRISQEDEVTDERDDAADDKVRCEIVENEHMLFGEHLTVRKPEFNSWLDKSQSLDEKGMLGQEHTEKLFETYPNWEENEQHGESGDEKENGLIYRVEHLWFESEQQLKEKISERKSEIFPKVEEVGEEVNVVSESEIDDNKLGHDGDGHKSNREYKEYEIVQRHMDTSEFEAAETTQTAASNFAEVQKGEVDWGTEETIDIQKAARRSEDNLDKFNFRECGSERDIGEAIDACNNDFGTISNDAHGNDTSNVFSEIQEPCDTEFNKAEHYQAAVEGYKENGSLSRATETFSAVEDKETGKLFHQEVNDMPGTDSLHTCTPEQNIIGGKLNSALEDFLSDNKTENASLIDADHEEKLLRDEDIFTTVSEIQIAAQEDDAKINMQNFPDLCPNNKAGDFDHRSIRQALERTVSASILEDIHGVSTHGTQECSANAEGKTLNNEEVERGLDMSSDGKEYVEERSELYFEDRSEEEYSQPNNVPEGTEKSMETRIWVETDQIMEKDKENHRRVSSMQKKDADGDEQKFETNDCRQRIEAIKRGREREKDRIAVERAIREARERAFAEARERAEKAAAERAAAEARQRVKAEAREKLAKASMESKQPVDKLSTEAKIRAERAAVERATVEARERALEKAVSQKTFIEARAQAEGYSTERFSSSSRNRGLKHSFSSSDLEQFDGTTSESAQRCKARLERHQRIMERAAKALAEKNKRDLLAQKELAERNRLAESLDGDIRRWVAGKEGNLRALLSTLQYILGPDSGWQPTSLTEIITTAAVKKAYRRATLCVHPDKLQQRGASIQQKYICEKVFDLLKAAWNRFNSEES